MAKAKKRKPARASYHHTTDHHHFLLIVGGGFLLMIMILLMYNNLPFINMYQKQVATVEDSLEQTSDQQVVTIENYIYSPNTITVKVGSSVMFKNNDSVAHTATADDGNFDTGTIQPGETGEPTFDKAGTYLYHCTLHPNMTGTVVKHN